MQSINADCCVLAQNCVLLVCMCVITYARVHACCIVCKEYSLFLVCACMHDIRLCVRCVFVDKDECLCKYGRLSPLGGICLHVVSGCNVQVNSSRERLPPLPPPGQTPGISYTMTHG